MTDSTPGIAKQYLIYGIGSISQTALSFLLLPVYMGRFAAKEYGIIAILFVIVQFSSMVASAGMMSALHRLYFTVTNEARRRLAGTSAIWHLSLGAMIGISLIIFADPIAKTLFGTIDRALETKLLGCYFLLNFSLEVPFNLLRLEERGAHYVAYSLLRFGIDFILKIFLVIVAGRGVIGYMESAIVAAAITLLIVYIAVRDLVAPRISLIHLRQMLRIGIPFILSGFAIWSLSATDRMFLNYFSGQSAVGLYAVGQKFSQIFNILLFTPCSLLLPAVIFRYAEEHAPSETKIMLARMMKILVIAGVIVYMGISLATRDLLYIFTERLGARDEYIQSISLIPILVIAPFAYYLTFCGSYALLLAKRPEFNAFAATIAAALNIVLNLFMVPQWGAHGAAFSTSISYIIYVSLVYYWAQRQYPVVHDWVGACILFAITLIIGAVLWIIPIHNNLIGLFVRAPIGILLTSTIIWFSPRIFPPSSKANLIKRLHSAFRRNAEI